MRFYHPYVYEKIVLEDKGGLLGVAPEFFGAFFGAFFAFLFGLLSYKVIKRHERFVLYKNALIKMERLLNEYIDLIDLNRGRTENITRTLAKGGCSSVRFDLFPFSPSLNLDLGSLFIMNEYFSHERRAHRVNSNLKMLNYSLTRLEDAVIAQPGEVPQDNWDHLSKLVPEMNEFLDKFDKDTIRMLAIVKLYVEKFRDTGIFYILFNKVDNVEFTEEEIVQKIKTVEEQLNEEQA